MKKTTKPILSLILLVGMLATCFVSVQASEISPRYTGIAMVSSTLNISSNGAAVCGGKTSVRSGYTVDLTVELKQDGSEIKTWKSSGSGIVTAGGTYYVMSGHEYVVTTTVEVYNSAGKLVESPSKDSPVSKY